MAESSFAKGFGGTIGGLAAVGCAVIAVLALMIGGCTVMVGGCTAAAVRVADSAHESQTRVRREYQAQQKAAEKLKDDVDLAPVDLTPPEPAPKPVAINITAPQLLEEYQANEVLADNRYKGKLLRVKGTVSKIGKDILNHSYVALQGKEFGIFTVQCMFGDEYLEQLASLRPGQILINIEGTCDGKFGNVLLRECYFGESETPEDVEKTGAPLDPQKETAAAAPTQPAQKPDPEPPKPKHELREWTDATGKHTIKATFLRLGAGKVTLLKENGKEVVMSINKLSQADRDYIMMLGKKARSGSR